MGHSNTSSRRAAAIAAALASAVAACFGPPSVLLPLLVFGMALLAIGMLAGTGAREPELVENDVAILVESVRRVSQGRSDPEALPRAPVRTPGAKRIGTAVNELAGHVRREIGMLRDAVQRDPLTGLTNRAHFERLVEGHLDERGPTGLCCLIFVDVDRFRAVNDTLGHNLGDRLIQYIAERLRVATRLGEDEGTSLDIHIARFGGDEFVIFIGGLLSEGPARRIAHRVLRVMAERFELSAHVTGLSASVGLAFVPADAAGYAELLRAADAAMQHAKRLGGNRVEQYTAQLDADLLRQSALERDLRDALARSEFTLHYQPQYDCRTLRISSAEALIRWHHPQRGLISPCEFIPLAEKSNLICDIGEWVLYEAAATIARFARQGMPLRISVNVSPQQLEQIEFVSVVKAALARCGADPKLLELEITEGVAMRDCGMAAERLARLAELGVSIAVDDFGTGYSNLASLVRLPISRLKIDRSLLLDLTSRAEVRTLAQTIISMANGLGFHSVAEGVEDAAQLTLLGDMGCDVVQGFLLSRPIVVDALERLLGETDHGDATYAKITAIAC